MDMTTPALEIMKRILCAQLPVKRDAVTPDALIMADLGADSLSILIIGFLLKQHFGCRIPPEVSDGDDSDFTVQMYCDLIDDLRSPRTTL